MVGKYIEKAFLRSFWIFGFNLLYTYLGFLLYFGLFGWLSLSTKRQKYHRLGVPP